jgi:hypothetical protein
VSPAFFTMAWCFCSYQLALSWQYHMQLYVKDFLQACRSFQ